MNIDDFDRLFMTVSKEYGQTAGIRAAVNAAQAEGRVLLSRAFPYVVERDNGEPRDGLGAALANDIRDFIDRADGDQ